MPIQLSDDMKEKIGGARDNELTCMLTTIDLDGYPSMSLRGSMMVFDDEHLAYWDRSLRGAAAHTKANPRVGVWFRDPGNRIVWRFTGDASQYPDGPIREQVMSRTIQRELDQDPERKGVAVLIKVNKVVDGRGQVVMER